MKLLIAIPALNEEQSIGQTVERCLDAATELVRDGVVAAVDVAVVSDGSSDRTATIAGAFVPRITLIDWKNNRGYGAAIKAAWADSDAELLGFLDADGTCDPRFFAVLCEALEDEGADIAIGSRVHDESEMPFVRRLGNRLYAVLLSAIAGVRVSDTASGMRVVRASALPALLPLPDGLHFTPAMSARAHLGRDLKIIERRMQYAEREGRSKLSVFRDGARFLRVILGTAAIYRPSRLFAASGMLATAMAVALLANPTWFFLRHHRVEEGMIYRFLFANLLGLAAVSLLSAGYLAGRMVDEWLFDGRSASVARQRYRAWLRGRRFAATAALVLVVSGILVAPAFVDRARTGHTTLHWSRVITMSFLCETLLVLVVTRLMDSFLQLASQRRDARLRLSGQSRNEMASGRRAP